MNLFNVLIGFVVLLTGRQLVWLFVGGLGFLAGASLGPRFIDADPAWLVWVFAIGLGIAGALLAVFLKRFAIAVAGFIGGWYLLTLLSSTYGWNFGGTWVIPVIGGIIGSILVSVVYDWALIFLSSILGAVTIVQNLDLDINMALFLNTLILLALIVTGVSVQSRVMIREKANETAKEKTKTNKRPTSSDS